MNTIFDKLIYTNINGRIFGQLDMLNVPIHRDILKYFHVVHDIQLDGMSYKIKIQDKTIHIIRENNCRFNIARLFIENERQLACIVPYDLGHDDFNQKKRVDIILSVYNSICTEISDYKDNDETKTLIELAPIILTLFTCIQMSSDLFLRDFIPYGDKHWLDEEFLNKILSCNIEELLDGYGIVALYQEHLRDMMSVVEEGDKNEKPNQDSKS